MLLLRVSSSSLVYCYQGWSARLSFIKVLATRLKSVLDPVIAENQTAFIKGRQMSDSILITSEIHSFLKAKKSEGVILKLDFEKAFDSINWEFLLNVMHKMKFKKKMDRLD